MWSNAFLFRNRTSNMACVLLVSLQNHHHTQPCCLLVAGCADCHAGTLGREDAAAAYCASVRLVRGAPLEPTWAGGCEKKCQNKQALGYFKANPFGVFKTQVLKQLTGFPPTLEGQSIFSLEVLKAPFLPPPPPPQKALRSYLDSLFWELCWRVVISALGFERQLLCPCIRSPAPATESAASQERCFGRPFDVFEGPSCINCPDMRVASFPFLGGGLST